MTPSLATKLYIDQHRCLHLESYRIYLEKRLFCGPCFFRDGVLDEIPSRASIKEASGLFGAPAISPQLITHLMISVGLVPPAPDQTLREFRAQRAIRSKPSPRQYPFTSALWDLMGYQPPLAKVLVKFCQNYNEVEIAEQLDLSIYNVADRLKKAVHTGQKFLRTQ